MLRRVVRVVVAIFMIAIGLAHFVRPAGFVAIVPSVLPAPMALVMISGFFEILGGVGLLVRSVRKLASYGLVALYIAVFPANVNMAIHDIQPEGLHVPATLLWLRLPFQIVFIGLALWVGREGSKKRQPARGSEAE